MLCSHGDIKNFVLHIECLIVSSAVKDYHNVICIMASLYWLGP